MKEALVHLICPTCASLTDVRADGEPAQCPKCGDRLTELAKMADGTPCAGSAVKDGPFTEESTAGDVLLSNLRTAFEYHSEALASADSCWLGQGGGSSAAYCGVHGAVAMSSGTRLGDFEILGELGRGGMGIVYRVRQRSLGREVALKVLPGYARHGPLAVKRFKAEARAAARIHHTNVVSIFGQGEHEGQYYYAMELIDGASLASIIHGRADRLAHFDAEDSSSVDQRILQQRSTGSRAESMQADSTLAESTQSAERPEALGEKSNTANWTPAEYRTWAGRLAEVADALECAHRQGVIHRDIKPHNILVGEDGRLHVMDFGLARLIEEPHLTCDGEVMGTPAYLSPEQLQGVPGGIDHRTDVYSLGVTLYELIARRKPFQGETRDQIIRGICAEEPVALRRLNPQVPRDLETICLRAMEKETEHRYPSAAILAEDLRRFSEGRPILSRRAGRIQRAWKWARRHKTQAALIAVSAVVLLIATGVAWNTHVVHRREARRLLQDAYGQLAFFDYQSPQRVEAGIARADMLGADPVELHLTRALAGMGSDDNTAAIHRLGAALEIDPDNLRALYMLAWAQWRNGDRTASRTTFKDAEVARVEGSPMAADAWLFRGLAIHYEDPDIAIDSYRQANALRARDQAYFPLAVLHLARARNQKLYATRSLDGFSEAESSLRQLIENEYYGAYPYYLLSITHRLAAEIYEGSQGTRDDSLVARHYAEAMKWAQAGQEIEPANDRPITAEAECLESMGRYAEAVQARSRAIAVASTDRACWEGFHYRWRLHYWLGSHDEALEDLAICRQYDPDSRFYAHFYPALVLAEMGRNEEAISHARAIAGETPCNALEVLWSATCLRLLGDSDEAMALLDERSELVDFQAGLVSPQTERWLHTLYQHCRMGDEQAALSALADEVESPWKLWGEAEFHIAAMQLGLGNRTGAQAAMQRSYRSFDSELGYTYQAKLIWKQMCEKPTWPTWIAKSQSDTHESGLASEGADESAVSGYSERNTER